MKSDAVTRGCIVNDKECNLIYKCDECKSEIANLILLDEMFIDYFKQLEYLKQRNTKTIEDEVQRQKLMYKLK